MRHLGSVVFAVPFAAVLIAGSTACARNGQDAPTRGSVQTGERTSGSVPGTPMGSMGSMASMMEHMQKLHRRFQDMADQSYWMHGGGMMPGSQQMMALSDDLASMAEAMRGAMDQMHSLSEQSEGENSAYSQHLEQMQQHMRSMSDQLDQMIRTMEEAAHEPTSS